VTMTWISKDRAWENFNFPTEQVSRV